jgi:hypothetical protein
MKRRIAKLAIAGSVLAGGIALGAGSATAAPVGGCQIDRLGNTVGTASCTGPVFITRINADCVNEPDPDFQNITLVEGQTGTFRFECQKRIRGIRWVI